MDRFLLVGAVLVTVAVVLPLLLNQRLIADYADCDLCTALASSEAVVPMTFCFATTVPMLVDVATYFLHKDSFYYLERLTLLCACNIPLLAIYLKRDSEMAGDVFICLYSAQPIWITVALFNGILQSKSKVWRPWRLYAVYTLVCISQGLTPYAEARNSTGRTLLALMNITFIIALVVYLFLFCSYLRQVIDHNEELVSSTNEYLPILCSSIVFAYSIAGMIGPSIFSFTYPEDMGQQGLNFYLLVTSMLTITTTLLPGRIARSQVREVQSNLEIKKSFVRYIGHEIRTPLNIASIGLDLLSQLYQSSPRGSSVVSEGQHTQGAAVGISASASGKSMIMDVVRSWKGEEDEVLPTPTTMNTTVNAFSTAKLVRPSPGKEMSSGGKVIDIQTTEPIEITDPNDVKQMYGVNYSDTVKEKFGDLDSVEDLGSFVQHPQPPQQQVSRKVPPVVDEANTGVPVNENINNNNLDDENASCDTFITERNNHAHATKALACMQDRDTVLQEVRNAIALSTNILNDLLSYEKLDSNNMACENSDLNIHSLVYNSLNMFSMQAEMKKIVFSIHIETDLPTLYGDEYKLRQVLCNLASNAMKFTPAKGSVIVHVKRDPRKPQHYLVIEVQDTGIGIARKNLSKVFKKIIQFDANKNQAGNGSGLGLYITRGLVELHGGTVSVYSDGLGSGCLFRIRLPFNRNRLHYYDNYKYYPAYSHRASSNGPIDGPSNGPSSGPSPSGRSSGSKGMTWTKLFTRIWKGRRHHTHRKHRSSGQSMTVYANNNYHSESRNSSVVERHSHGPGYASDRRSHRPSQQHSQHRQQQHSSYNEDVGPNNNASTTFGGTTADDVDFPQHLSSNTNQAALIVLNSNRDASIDIVDDLEKGGTGVVNQTHSQQQQLQHHYMRDPRGSFGATDGGAAVDTTASNQNSVSFFAARAASTSSRANPFRIVPTNDSGHSGYPSAAIGGIRTLEGSNSTMDRQSSLSSSVALQSFSSTNSYMTSSAYAQSPPNAQHPNRQQNMFSGKYGVLEANGVDGVNGSGGAAGIAVSGSLPTNVHSKSPEGLKTAGNSGKSPSAPTTTNTLSSVPEALHGKFSVPALMLPVASASGSPKNADIYSGHQAHTYGHGFGHGHGSSHGQNHNHAPSARVGPGLTEVMVSRQSSDDYSARLDTNRQNSTGYPVNPSLHSAFGSHPSNNNSFNLDSPRTVAQQRSNAGHGGRTAGAGNHVSSARWLDGLVALLVDDSHSSLKLLSLLLKRHGCTCITACDGTEAVVIVREAIENHTTIDFVLMDNFMPELCGPGACQEMRSLGFDRPILGLTGHALDDDIAAYRDAGANDVLVKPLDISTLQTRLKKFIPSLR
jgi:signal transduction histidine kinase/CheY-like chemotaxis protein